jgi:hypothetical protein
VKPAPRTRECPHCGARVAARAPACPACGSDARTGWSEQAGDFAGDLPTGYDDDPDFDYQEALAAEGLSGGRPSRAALRRRRVAAVALLLVACLLAWLVVR